MLFGEGSVVQEEMTSQTIRQEVRMVCWMPIYRHWYVRVPYVLPYLKQNFTLSMRYYIDWMYHFVTELVKLGYNSSHKNASFASDVINLLLNHAVNRSSLVHAHPSLSRRLPLTYTNGGFLLIGPYT